MPPEPTPASWLRAAATTLSEQAAAASPAPWTQSGRYDGQFFPSADGGHLAFGDQTAITTFHDGRYADGTLIATMRTILPAVLDALTAAADSADTIEEHEGRMPVWDRFPTELRIAGLVLGVDTTRPPDAIIAPSPFAEPPLTLAHLRSTVRGSLELTADTTDEDTFFAETTIRRVRTTYELTGPFGHEHAVITGRTEHRAGTTTRYRGGGLTGGDKVSIIRTPKRTR